jgi:hypothetical protein
MDRLGGQKDVRRNGNSGQILLIAAFIMASLLLSAQLYILEVGKISGETNSEVLNDFMLNVKLGSRHVVVGSLANISNGGAISILEQNLQKWADFIGSQYLQGKNTMNITLDETTPYSSGTWLSWGVNGYGVSSACADFAHSLDGREENVDLAYSVNVTTALLIASVNQGLNETTRQVSLTINVLNEAHPALAEQITVYYRVSSTWLIPDSASNYRLQNYGNGTYVAYFTAIAPLIDEVSVHATDFRGIYVQANVTSTEI